MAASTFIPEAVVADSLQAVEQFNRKHKTRYEISFSNRFAYIVRYEDFRSFSWGNSILMLFLGLWLKPDENAANTKTVIARLEWLDNEEGSWEFELYLYDTKQYEPIDQVEYPLPGIELFDGTVRGALNAGHKIYK